LPGQGDAARSEESITTPISIFHGCFKAKPGTGIQVLDRRPSMYLKPFDSLGKDKLVENTKEQTENHKVAHAYVA
jgi:hypothetical protein